MSGISTHVLDTALGKPAADLAVQLLVERGGGLELLAQTSTDANGRVSELLAGADLELGTYHLRFDTEAYLCATQGTAFYPQVEVVFRVADATGHYHIPLLLSPYGYSTYRGS